MSIAFTQIYLVPPNLPPFLANETIILSTSSRSINISLPDVTIEFLGGQLTNFTFTLQGYLTLSRLLQAAIFKREINILDTTAVTTVITGAGNQFVLSGLKPNYEYFVNVSANNSVGATAAVQLSAILIDSASKFLLIHLKKLTLSVG